MKTVSTMNPPKPPPAPGPPRPLPVASQRVQAVFADALEVEDLEARERFLAEALPGEPALQAQVRGLLEAHERAGDFLADLPDSPELQAELARLKPEEAGDRIGPYKLLQQLGEGGFGVVWMAEQEQPVRRRVALKIIKLGMDTKEVIARFEQERQALAMMEHSNIARVLDAGSTPLGRPYFAMELVRGIKITEFCDQNHLSTQERLELFIQVCYALQHAHQKGIIHRDLKPSNILVTLHDGVPVPKVIDFGVAKAMQQRLTERTLFTQFQQIIGTPLYMSPEQAEMSGLDIDTRSDIYSLGVLLYELLAGRTPFDAEEMARRGIDEVRHMIREHEPPRPSTALVTMGMQAQTTVAASRGSDFPKLVGLLRGDLDWIVMKALEKDRARRYDTAGALALDIQRHLVNEPILARPASQLYRLQRLIRRNQAAFAATVIVILTLLAGTAVSVWQAQRAEKAARLAEGEAVRANQALADLRSMAPALVAQARDHVVQGRFDDALEKLNQARRLQPDDREILRARANLLQAQLKLEEAGAQYREILRTSPHDIRAERNAALCERLRILSAPTGGKLGRENLAELFQEMFNDQRPAAEILPIARQLGEEKSLALAYWRERLRDLPVPFDTPLEQCLTMRRDGLLKLDLTGSSISDLKPLAGMPLGELVLSGCTNVVDLTPIRELPLRSLDLTRTAVADLVPLRGLHLLELLQLGRGPVTDLTPLRGLPLRSLFLIKLSVTDLSPLAGMPLRQLVCQSLSASDYSHLAGMPISELMLHDMPIKSLEAFRGMPLHTLVLSNSRDLRGLKFLDEFPKLEVLVLPWPMGEIPDEELEAIAALRERRPLRQLASKYKLSGSNPVTSIGGKDEFFREWDTAVAWKLPLLRQGGKIQVEALPDGTSKLTVTGRAVSDISSLRALATIDERPFRSLVLNGTAVENLAPLSGLALTRLSVNDTKVDSFSPLAGIPLTRLEAAGTKVADLSPLAGMPLTRLEISKTEVADLGPLSGLPLQWLRATDTPVSDLSPVAGLKQLTDLGIGGTKVADLTPLKGLPIEILQISKLAVPDLEALRGMPLRQLYAFEVTSKDLEPLRGSALEHLHLGSSNFGDLAPLAECRALTYVNVTHTPVEDVRPLAGLALRELHLGNSKVRDLSPVRGLPLHTMTVDHCPIADAAVLLEIPTLERLVVSRAAPGVAKLRGHPNLKYLATRWDGEFRGPAVTVQRFWQEWDAKNR